MDEYRSQNKLLDIKSINPQKMVLEDDSQWEFLGAAHPPLSWQAGDQIVIEKTGGKFPTYRVINKTREKQEITAVYLGGGITKEQMIEINKSLKDYPDERLDRDWRIERLLDDGSILLEDKSVWQLTNPTLKNEGEWYPKQLVRISKGSSGLKTYHITNLNMNRPPFIGSFLGFQE